MSRKEFGKAWVYHCNGDKKTRGPSKKIFKTIQEELKHENDEKEKDNQEKKSDNAENKEQELDIKVLTSLIRSNIVEDEVDYMDPVTITNSNKERLRSCVKRNNKDVILRWIKIGCGSCFICEKSGTQYEIPSNDPNRIFTEMLKEAMIRFEIHCKLPCDLDRSKAQWS